MESPILIAHRGYAKRYPENTLVSIEAALLAGANCIEFDVQFTSDGIPVVLHDASLKRTTGVNKRIFTVDAASLGNIVVNEAKEHPKKFANVGIPTLESVVRLLSQWPKAKAFVEIKQESIDKFGIERVVRTLIGSCQPIMDRAILIAYDALALRCGRAMGFKSVGWILKKYDAAGLSMATELAPDYLICNYTKLPKTLDKLWPGPWQWAFYEVTQAKVAYELVGKGAKYIETMAVSEMLKDLAHKKHACTVE
ncbi:MAG: glycerophosphodiester phosphodiesterase [Gammaproteobacteria bacterium]|nr:glycerophosphodiester phosphodiesterase [Gammaproteobacteria bacterium]